MEIYDLHCGDAAVGTRIETDYTNLRGLIRIETTAKIITLSDISGSTPAQFAN
jgi:hypothetical protein